LDQAATHRWRIGLSYREKEKLYGFRRHHHALGTMRRECLDWMVIRLFEWQRASSTLPPDRVKHCGE
jgi:hypothetical protein